MKFRFSPDLIIDSDVEPWRREGLRIGMLGGPGSGKSWNNSLIAEQFLRQGGTVVIFQPRDEYFTLKEKFDILSVGGVHAKDMEFALTSPSIYAKAVVEDGISMIFYTSAAENEEKLVDWVSRFIRHVLNYQERHKRPLLLILEEAHEYAPRTATGHIAPPWVYNRMIKAFKDCFTQGRKLNIIAVASSQRPQELNFTIRQLANLSFYGKFSDQDIGYVDKECLKYVRKRGIEIDASRLVELGLGEWLVIMGKRTRFITVTEQRLTKHGAETPRLEYVVPRATKAKKTIDQLSKAVMEALQKEEAEKSELVKAKRKIRELTKKLEVAEEKARIKLSVKDMLQGDGDKEELAEKLATAEETISTQRRHLAESDKTIERLTGELEELQALRDLKEALRKVFSAMDIAPGLEPGAPSEVVVSQEIPQVTVKRPMPRVEADESNYRGQLIICIAEGFFDEPRKLWPVRKELQRRYGVIPRADRTSQELVELCRMHLLERFQEGKTWSYRIYPGAKERIKTKEVEA